MRIRSIVFPLFLASILCGGCSTAPETSRVFDAAATPLSDLNLVNAKIPSILLDAQKHPYHVPTDVSCESIAAHVRALDEVLGADLDAPATESNPGLIERGSVAATNYAANTVRRTAEGLVPFRSWVRKLSGAERYSKDVAAAIAAGTIRRAFLKGMVQAKGCSGELTMTVAP